MYAIEIKTQKGKTYLYSPTGVPKLFNNHIEADFHKEKLTFTTKTANSVRVWINKTNIKCDKCEEILEIPLDPILHTEQNEDSYRSGLEAGMKSMLARVKFIISRRSGNVCHRI